MVPNTPERRVDLMIENETHSTCSCKIGRNIDKYGLDDLNQELTQKRKTNNASLRDLADYINQRILGAALSDAGVDSTDTLYDAISGDEMTTELYESLTSDDTPTERVARLRTRLTQLGVDIDTVESDWVTHPTVRSHLRECQDIDTARSANLTADDARDTIEWARTQCVNIVAQTFTRLRNAGIVSTGSLNVTLTIQITCTNCGDTYRPGQLLNHRTCSCSSEGTKPPET